MNKLKLSCEDLVVESFQTAASTQLRGTVRGNASAIEDGCLTETDELSCPGSCEVATCDDRCGGSGGCGGGSEFTCRLTAPAPDTCCQALC